MMGIRIAGDNLSQLLADAFLASNYPFEVIEYRTGRPIAARIDGVLCYMKYANLNRVGNWYFGFHPDDVEELRSGFNYAILICGTNDIFSIYVIPFELFATKVASGKIVYGSGRSPQYQLHIFPENSDILKITGATVRLRLNRDEHIIYADDFDETVLRAIVGKLDVEGE